MSQSCGIHTPCAMLAIYPRVASLLGTGAAGVPPASSHHNKFLLGIRRQRPQRLLPPVLENKRKGRDPAASHRSVTHDAERVTVRFARLTQKSDRLAQIRQTLFPSLPLTIRTRHFGAVRDIPFTAQTRCPKKRNNNSKLPNNLHLPNSRNTTRHA